MHTRSSIGAFLIPFGLFLTACGGDGPIEPGDAVPPPDGIRAALIPSLPAVCGSESIDLFADQAIDIGSVAIANDEHNLYVSFETGGGWELAATHVAVATDPALFPTVGRRLAPGRFPDKAAHDPRETTVHYAVPLSDPPPATVYVAAHADVVNGTREEGAWVEGESRDGGGWASWATYDLAACAIGPGGGEVETEYGTLVFPPGAVSEDVEPTIEPVDDSALPDGVLPGTAIDVGPDGLEFSEPVMLTIPYDDTGLSPEEEGNISIHLLQDDGTLLALPTVVDMAANTATAELMHFSTYVVALPEARLVLRVGGTGYSDADGSVEAGSQLRYTVFVFNLSSTLINGGDVMVEFTAQGLVAEFGVSYSTGLCAPFVQPDPTTYEFTCTLNPSHDIEPGTAGVRAFNFTTAPGSEGGTFDVSAGFTYGTWVANTGTVSTDVVAGPGGADLFVSVEPHFTEVPVGQPVMLDVLVGNDGPENVDGAVEFFVHLLSGDVVVNVVPSNCMLDTPGTYKCEISAGLTAGLNESHIFTVTPQSAGLTVVEGVVVVPPGVVDPEPGNNSSVADIDAN